MFIDLDDFKNINDSHGHEAGDEVLKTIATRRVANARDGDTVGRHGGDEFLCLHTEVEHEHEQDITLIAKKISASIQMPCHVTVDGVTANPCIGASIGVAVFPKIPHPERGVTMG